MLPYTYIAQVSASTLSTQLNQFLGRSIERHIYFDHLKVNEGAVQLSRGMNRMAQTIKWLKRFSTLTLGRVS